MISFEDWLQEEVPFTGGLTREQYYKRFVKNGNPRELYDFITRHGIRNENSGEKI